MNRRSTLAALSLAALSLAALPLALGCGVDSDFSNSTSQALFDDANAELHAMHIDALGMENWPDESVRECEGGGTIEMATDPREDGGILNLRHEFMACKLGELTLSGSLDYFDVTRPDCNGAEGYAFDIDGDLGVSGSADGQCSMTAREACGKITGTTCGYDL